MLFYLDEHFVAEVLRNETSAISAIDLISLGRKHGKHLLLAERESLKLIRDSENVNNDTKRVFTFLFENYPTFAYIKDKLTFYVKIVIGTKHMIIRQSGDKNIFELSYDYLQQINIITETIIIGENQTEISFYEFLSKYYKRNNGLNSVPACFDPMMGGGSTTHIVYKAFQQKEQKFCLCFVDSDKKYPQGMVGDTLKAVKKVDDNTKLLSQLHELTAREIENLIPLSILENVCKEDINFNNGLETLKKIVKTENSKDILFLDFKNGLSIKSYRKITDINLKLFLDNLLTVTNLFCQNKLDEIYQHKDEDEIEIKILIPGLGTSVLDRTIKYLAENETIDPVFDFEEQLRQWEVIGRKFANWTCSGAKII